MLAIKSSRAPWMFSLNGIFHSPVVNLSRIVVRFLASSNSWVAMSGTSCEMKNPSMKMRKSRIAITLIARGILRFSRASTVGSRAAAKSREIKKIMIMLRISPRKFARSTRPSTTRVAFATDAKEKLTSISSGTSFFGFLERNFFSSSSSSCSSFRFLIASVSFLICLLLSLKNFVVNFFAMDVWLGFALRD